MHNREYVTRKQKSSDMLKAGVEPVRTASTNTQCQARMRRAGIGETDLWRGLPEKTLKSRRIPPDDQPIHGSVVQKLFIISRALRSDDEAFL
jgi:hypothetical protein